MCQFLNSLFTAFDNNYCQLAYEIQREFRQSGSPDITRIELDRVKYDTVSGKGSFRAVFDITFSFGCEDKQTEKEDQTSEWTFDIDGAGKAIRFYSSPFAESRSTADEF